MKIVTVEQMRKIEKSADSKGLTYDTMMQNSGTGIANWLLEHLNLKAGVVGLVGSGNNGGDTLIALSSLSQRGFRTCAFLLKERQDDTLLTRYILQGGSAVELFSTQKSDMLSAQLQPGTVILDGIFGTGIKLPLREPLGSMMAMIQTLRNNRPEMLVVAVDCPSGVDCDTGEASPQSFRAFHTLVMAANKRGLLQSPARSLAGQFHLIDIGIGDINRHINDKLPTMIDRAFVSGQLPCRPETGHKGTFGTCLVIAGSAPYTGAAYLTGKAAYRAGCGLVEIATLAEVRQSLAGSLPEAIWSILPGRKGFYDPAAINQLVGSLKKADSLVVGPGWGVSAENAVFLDRLLAAIPPSLPVLLDADGLKCLSRLESWWERLPPRAILTPHPGEMAILTGMEISAIESDRWAIAEAFAQQWQTTVVLKGALTIIATSTDIWINPISTSALATAGSGDVLSGIIGGFLAQGSSISGAGITGVWLHAQAGLLSSEAIGVEQSVTAMDLLDYIGGAIFNLKEAGI